LTVIWDGPAPAPRQFTVSRRCERVPLSVAITICAGWQTHAGWSVNISEGGIAFVSPIRLEIGREISLTYSLLSHVETMTVGGVVRYVNRFEHGLEFWSIRPEDRQAITDFINEVRRLQVVSYAPARTQTSDEHEHL
jgi:hypothetical protein